MDHKRKTLLIISQVYVPDPASVGQHIADAAAEMAQRGWHVTVLTSNRGYEDPSIKYQSREVIDGVKIRRLPFSSFGKKLILFRLVGGISFIIQAIIRGLLTKNLAGILISTSPPLCPIAAMAIAAIKRAPITYWVMDLNPDQMIALGRIKPTALSVKLFDAMNRMILSRASKVVALDRFMADRLAKKCPHIERNIVVVPPWPHDDHLEVVPHEKNHFRDQHGLNGKFVVMFSGNLSIASPVDTILEAALQLQNEKNLVFMFIGGGLGKKMVEKIIHDHQPTNIISLPYQPLSQIKYSLSAADVHLVSMGDAIVGICHPCKVYGAMAVARPILLLGPQPCHISDIMKKHAIGWHIAHGDVKGAIQAIRQIRETPSNELAMMGNLARQIITRQFSKSRLCKSMCDTIATTPMASCDGRLSRN